MSKNGIRTLATKQLRQEAKLTLAASKRAADSAQYLNAIPDVDLLPKKPGRSWTA